MAASKPGFKTTEFWLNLLAVVIGAFLASGALGQEHWAVQIAGLALSALSALGYTSSRSKTKAADALRGAAEAAAGAWEDEEEDEEPVPQKA